METKSLTSIQTLASMVTPNPNITDFLNVKLDEGNYMRWRSQFLPLLSSTISKASSTEPLRVRSGSFHLPRRMLSPLSIQNTLAGSSLIRCSYVGLSPRSLWLFLLMSSASPHLVMCGALWSESLRHPPELE